MLRQLKSSTIIKTKWILLREHETLNHEQIQSLYNTGKMPETYDGTEEHVESNDDNNNTPEPPKADPEDDLLDEMK